MGKQLLRRVEPDGEDDGVALGDCVLDRRGAREQAELLGERLRPCLVLGSENDGLAPVCEVSGNRASERADTDD